MFQYAAARALAIRNSAQLYLDTRSGFARDRAYRRTFGLSVLPIKGKTAGLGKRAPFWFERARDRILGTGRIPIRERPWGSYIRETQTAFLDEISKWRNLENAWMHGYWQCEGYFDDLRSAIANDLTPPIPKDPQFREMAKAIESCNSIAVGVRLFEEVPGATKIGVGGLTPIAFYEVAANRLADHIANPVFFVFCTRHAPALQEINFPGKVHYITHDNGFEGAISRLWLLTKCLHHIVSNSSFYWWGAWLAEQQRPDTRIIASPLFTNQDTLPHRWLAIRV